MNCPAWSAGFTINWNWRRVPCTVSCVTWYDVMRWWWGWWWWWLGWGEECTQAGRTSCHCLTTLSAGWDNAGSRDRCRQLLYIPDRAWISTNYRRDFLHTIVLKKMTRDGAWRSCDCCSVTVPTQVSDQSETISTNQHYHLFLSEGFFRSLPFLRLVSNRIFFLSLDWAPDSLSFVAVSHSPQSTYTLIISRQICQYSSLFLV